MDKLAIFRWIVLAAAAAAVTASCSRSGEEGGGDSPLWTANDGVLGYVPADTPYLFAKVGPTPDDVADKFEPWLDATLETYKEVVQAAVSNLDLPEADDEGHERAVAVADSVAGLLSVQGLRDAGVERDSTMVLYGSGLLPVLRITLSDGNKLEAAVAKIEDAAGRKMTVAALGDHTYRYAGDENARFVMAVIDDAVVLSLVPAELSDDQLMSIFGLTAPATSIASSGTLREIAIEYEFEPYYAGFLDIDRIAATFLEDQSGVNAELLSLMRYDDSALSDVCRSELRDMANVASRMILGYTAVGTDRLSTNTIIELREDIAAGLATVAAPVPGFGAMGSGLLSVGMGFDLLAARTFYSDRLDSIEADPYECEMFADMQDGVDAGREALDTPVPPFVYDFKGLVAVVDDIQGMDLAMDQPPTRVDMRFLVATDNAMGLVAMGSMFSPEVAALNLQPDGQPVRLDVPQLALSPIESAYVAMTPDAIAVATGDDAQARLSEMLSAPAAEQSTFLSWDVDGVWYQQLVNQATLQAAETDEDMPLALRQAATELMTPSLLGPITRMTLDVRFTERGIELPYTMTLGD